MKTTLTGDWDEARRILSTLPDRVMPAARQAIIREAHFLRGEMVKGIQSGAPAGKAFKPHSPWTVAVRRLRGFGGSKIMIVSGALMGSIGVIPLGNGAFVGVRRKAKRSGSRGGMSLINLAQLHEQGKSFTVTVTPRMRGFLAWVTEEMYGEARAPAVGTTLKITIPARPFIGPILEKWTEPRQQVVDRIAHDMGKLLGGDLGSA